MTTPTEQFDALCRALRAFPERILQLGHYVAKVGDPEEGLARIEAAFRDVLTHYEAMISAVTAQGIAEPNEGRGAIPALIGLGHAVEAQGGCARTLLRALVSGTPGVRSVLIDYGTADKERDRCPYAVNIAWLEQALLTGEDAAMWDEISGYWNLDAVKQEAEAKSLAWEAVYIDATLMISEAVRQLCADYGGCFSPEAEDSKGCFAYFSQLAPLDKADFALMA